MALPYDVVAIFIALIAPIYYSLFQINRKLGQLCVTNETFERRLTLLEDEGLS